MNSMENLAEREIEVNDPLIPGEPVVYTGHVEDSAGKMFGTIWLVAFDEANTVSPKRVVRVGRLDEADNTEYRFFFRQHLVRWHR